MEWSKGTENKKKMKIGIGLILLGMFFLLIIPSSIVLFFGNLFSPGEGKYESNTEEKFSGKVEIPKEVRVWRNKEGKAETVGLEEYVCCVVASEMPSTFHIEALKAQSIAARTYVMSKIVKYGEKKPSSHEEAPVCDTVHCQVFKTEKELLQAHSEEWFKSKDGFEKVKEACKATEGQLLYYQNKLVMQPLFFSSSGGQTENSEDVFVSAIPYLVSVSSPYEEKATHQNEKKVYSLQEFQNEIKSAMTDLNFGVISEDKIKILSRTAGGRVEKMMVGNETIKGTDVRMALGLSSCMFSISFDRSKEGQKQIVFTSNGSGHGVGMSQYGADGMAMKGYSYKEILRHYYSGTEVH